jgi:sigma-70-like protein
VRHSLARLSPEHGEVIDLVYYHGKSVREVAEIVGVAQRPDCVAGHIGLELANPAAGYLIGFT